MEDNDHVYIYEYILLRVHSKFYIGISVYAQKTMLLSTHK